MGLFRSLSICTLLKILTVESINHSFVIMQSQIDKEWIFGQNWKVKHKLK